MGTRIHCVRHAQGFHNLSEANHAMRDPLLTPHGQQQCQDLKTSFPYHDQIDLVVASPLKRTIYTALLAFGDVIASKQLKVIGLPELQETSELPCDTGSEVEDLAREFENQPVDLSLVKPGWEVKRLQFAPYAKAIETRARVARQWLAARSEKNIVVVTHGGFLHYFTEDWRDSDKFLGTGWANTEFRSYIFSKTDPEFAHLAETPESCERRAVKPLDREEKTNIDHTATKDYEQQAQQQTDRVKHVSARLNDNKREGVADAY